MELQLLLAAIAALARNRGESDIAEYLELGGKLAIGFMEGRAEVKAEVAQLRTDVEAMVAAGRDPSPAERAAVRDRRHELSQAIQALGRTDRPGDDPPTG
jgi:hypothetical protein